MLLRSAVVISLLPLAAACAARAPIGPGSELLRRASRLIDPQSGAELSWEQACDRLATAEVVFLGETHLDRLTHDAELELLGELADRRRNQVALVMEMFERDVQPALDDYLAGRIDEPTFLASARPWGNYASDYRPLVELASERAIPVVASNLPADLRRKLSRGGEAAWNALTGPECALVPARLIESPPEYWTRVDNVTRSHGALGMAPAGNHRYDGQNLWDNTMADSIARQLAREPDRLVIHVNGGFHSEQHQGTVWQLLQRRPATRVLTVAIEASSDLAAERKPDSTPAADLVVLVEARAHSAEDGVAAVHVASEHGYRLRVPPHATAPLPLLVWLPESGQGSEQAMRLWEPVLGDAAACAVVEPSFPQLDAGGAKRGRWFFPGEAAEGGGLAATVIARLLEVVTRADLAAGLAIDPARVVLAGEGGGATMVLYATRYLEEEPFRALAFAPIAQEELARLPLPLPLEAARPERSLGLSVLEADQPSWMAFTHDDAALRLRTTVTAWSGPSNLATTDAAEVDAVRAALGLTPLTPSAAADALLAAAPADAAGRLMARQRARRARGKGLAVAPSSQVTAAAFADGSLLPLSSGAFGGTTIVVVPDDASEAELAAWLALESPDVIQKRSRFHRLRIAHGQGDRSPRAVIEKLRAESAERRDFLLVPAAFCVDEAELQALRANLGDLADQLHLELLPGLGDRLPVGG